jgi:hypothetical protein
VGVSVASVAHVDSLFWVLEFLGVNQSETPNPLVFIVRSWIAFAFHSGAPCALLITYFMVSPRSSERKFHCQRLCAGCPDVCVLHHP